MIIKSISLNIKLVRKEIAAMIPALVSGYLLYFMGNPYVVYLLMVLGLIIQLKGGCKIFCSSIYREESNLYMALPLDNKSIIWGKTLTCAFWAMLQVMIITSMVIIRHMAYSKYPSLNVLKNVYNNMLPELDLGLTPVETGVVVGFRLIQMIMWVCGTGFFIMAMQRVVSKRGRNGNKGYLVVLAILAGTVVGIGVLILVTFLEAKGGILWLVETISFAVLIGGIYGLWRYVKKEFDANFDAM